MFLLVKILNLSTCPLTTNFCVYQLRSLKELINTNFSYLITDLSATVVLLVSHLTLNIDELGLIPRTDSYTVTLPSMAIQSSDYLSLGSIPSDGLQNFRYGD